LDNSLKKFSFSVDQIYTKETRDPNMPVRVLLVLGGYDILHNFQQYFSYIMAVSFIDDGKQ
jgi:hypothetical protein